MSRPVQAQVATLAATLEARLHSFGASRRTLHAMVTLWPTNPDLFTSDIYNGVRWREHWQQIQDTPGLHPDVYTLGARVGTRNLREVSEFIGLMRGWGGPETFLAILDAVNPTWQDGYERVAALVLLAPTLDEVRDWQATDTTPSLDTALTLLALTTPATVPAT